MKTSDFRKELPFLETQTFLNFAATCPVPKKTLQVMTEETLKMQEPLGLHFYKSLNLIEMARKEIATLIGAHPGEICFVQNTSSAVSTIALALRLKKGDVVLVPDNEFPSNFFPWKNLEKENGIVVRTFKIPKDLSITDILANTDLTNVKVISLSAISFETGISVDLKAFADFCRSHKIYSCVDAIQAVGNIPLDCHETGIDFLASGSQKWLLGPVGCGIVYARKEHLEKLFVPLVGWTSHLYPEYFDLSELKFSQDMTRFEPGLPNYLPIIGTGESVKFLKSFNLDDVYATVQSHQAHLINGLKQMNVEFLHGESNRLGGIISFKFPKGVDHRLVHDHYHTKKVSITARETYVRVSPHFLTTEKELNHFLDVTSHLFKTSVKTLHTDVKVTQKAPSDFPILINGATGNLGTKITQELTLKGHRVFLIGRSEEKLKELVTEKNKHLIAGTLSVDFNDKTWADRLPLNQKFQGLINTSGEMVCDLLENQNEEEIRSLFEAQFFGPLKLMQIFLKHWKTPDTHGILNVLSSSGRCGYPLLSTYASAHAALWTLTESIQRESGHEVPCMVSIVPSQHSPLQKLTGRNSLRYYKVGKSFDYALTQDVAKNVVSQFLNGEKRWVDSSVKTKLWVNSLAPGFFDSQIAKFWNK
jgi:cysteine desulfurase/selenocysteine lyase